jgi:hypothetical protein
MSILAEITVERRRGQRSANTVPADKIHHADERLLQPGLEGSGLALTIPRF